MPQHSAVEKPAWAPMWQRDQSHERLSKTLTHRHEHDYLMRGYQPSDYNRRPNRYSSDSFIDIDATGCSVCCFASSSVICQTVTLTKRPPLKSNNTPLVLLLRGNCSWKSLDGIIMIRVTECPQSVIVSLLRTEASTFPWLPLMEWFPLAKDHFQEEPFYHLSMREGPRTARHVLTSRLWSRPQDTVCFPPPEDTCDSSIHV